MLLIALRIYATGGMQRTIGDVFGFSNSTVSKTFKVVSHHIAMLKNKFIRMPNTSDELAEEKQRFYNIAKMPNVIAAMDCTHVRIISPGKNCL